MLVGYALKAARRGPAHVPGRAERLSWPKGPVLNSLPCIATKDCPARHSPHVLAPAVIAEGVAALHGGGLCWRHIAHAHHAGDLQWQQQSAWGKRSSSPCSAWRNNQQGKQQSLWAKQHSRPARNPMHTTAHLAAAAAASCCRKRFVRLAEQPRPFVHLLLPPLRNRACRALHRTMVLCARAHRCNKAVW